MPPDVAAAGLTLWVGHQEMALLSYEEHEGDIGDDTEVEDEAGGIGGQQGAALCLLSHVGTTKETDDVRNQEECDMNGNFILTWRERTQK